MPSTRRSPLSAQHIRRLPRANTHLQANFVHRGGKWKWWKQISGFAIARFLDCWNSIQSCIASRWVIGSMTVNSLLLCGKTWAQNMTPAYLSESSPVHLISFLCFCSHRVQRKRLVWIVRKINDWTNGQEENANNKFGLSTITKALRAYCARS